MVFSGTQIKSQRVIRWRLGKKYSGSNIQRIAVVDNIVADLIGIFLSTTSNQYAPSTTRDHSQVKQLFTIIVEQTVEDGYHIDLALVQQEQQKEPRKKY